MVDVVVQQRGEQAAVSAANVGLEDRLTRTQLRAPMAGIVKAIKVGTVGGVVQPGIDLIEIVPVEDSLLIEAKVKPADIAFLKLGQDGLVKLSAYDFAIYGGLERLIEATVAREWRRDDGAMQIRRDAAVTAVPIAVIGDRKSVV